MTWRSRYLRNSERQMGLPYDRRQIHHRERVGERTLERLDGYIAGAIARLDNRHHVGAVELGLECALIGVPAALGQRGALPAHAVDRKERGHIQRARAA